MKNCENLSFRPVFWYPAVANILASQGVLWMSVCTHFLISMPLNVRLIREEIGRLRKMNTEWSHSWGHSWGQRCPVQQTGNTVWWGDSPGPQRRMLSQWDLCCVWRSGSGTQVTQAPWQVSLSLVLLNDLEGQALTAFWKPGFNLVLKLDLNKS